MVVVVVVVVNTGLEETWRKKSLRPENETSPCSPPPHAVNSIIQSKRKKKTRGKKLLRRVPVSKFSSSSLTPTFGGVSFFRLNFFNKSKRERKGGQMVAGKRPVEGGHGMTATPQFMSKTDEPVQSVGILFPRFDICVRDSATCRPTPGLTSSSPFAVHAGARGGGLERMGGSLKSWPVVHGSPQTRPPWCETNHYAVQWFASDGSRERGGRGGVEASRPGAAALRRRD